MVLKLVIRWRNNMCCEVYSTVNGSHQVELPSSVINYLFDTCKNSRNKETGGILIGCYSSDQAKAYVHTVTTPPKGSIQTSNTFFRSNTGLFDVLNRYWIEGKYYIGEWHYHPRAAATPSHIDIAQMIQLSNNTDLKCPEPILIIVGGNAQKMYFGVYLFENNALLSLKKCDGVTF